MSDYSCLSILKTKAKKLVRIQKIKLNEAQEIVAKEAQFASYHELREVAKRDPFEKRLVRAAMGESSLEEVICRDEVIYAIDREVEEQLSGEIAETNAYGFEVANIEATTINYDQKRGVLAVQAAFDYEGQPDTEHFYSGSSFSITAEMQLLLRENEWSLVEDSLVLTSVVSDVDEEEWYDLEV